ncbi:MAG: carboxypeptidase regulatory-like domain-containing protein [Kofleriaceae bacterium]
MKRSTSYVTFALAGLALGLATLWDGNVRHGELAPPAAAVTTPASLPAVAHVVAPAAVREDHVLLVRVVAGAEVNLSDGSGPIKATAIADPAGLARFPDLAPGPYELWARRGTEVSPLARTELAEPVTLALAPGGSVRGQLTGLEGAATITLVPIDVDHAMRIARVDDRGRFAIEGVPYGHWRVEVDAAGYVQQDDAIADVAARTPIAELAVTMARAGTLTGSVVDANASPIANATIVLHGRGVRTEDRSHAATATRLRWVHPLAGSRLVPTRDFVKFGGPRSGVRPAECGQGHCGADIGWQRGTVVHAAADGEIVSAFTESRGEAGRYVAIDHGNGLRTYYMHLDELRTGLEIGRRVRAGEPLGAMGSTGAAMGPHLHFAMTQQRGGRIWFIDPEPVLRIAVVLPAARALDPLTDTTPVIAAAQRNEPTPTVEPRTVTTDANGRFRVDGIAPGTYVAVAAASDLAPGTSAAFTVRTGAETTGVAITLYAGTLVQGRVTGRDGPIANATVVAVAGTGENAHAIATTTANELGEYTLRALSGDITLAVVASGYGETERPIALGAARTRQREDFTMVIENARLRGQIVAPDGGPPGPISLRVIDGPTRRTATTDAAGRFTIDRVAVGTYVVETKSAEYPSKRVTLQTEQWGDVRLERGGSVRCVLRDARSAEPLAGIRVDATGPGAATATATTDARGVAELRALAVGEWTVRARAKGYTEQALLANVRAQSVPQDLELALSRGATVAGVVRDRNGRRVANAHVWTDGATTQSDGDGNFKLVDAPSGAHWLEAELDGFRAAIQLQLAPGDDRAAITLELR